MTSSGSIQSVLVLHAGSLGDCVLALHLGLRMKAAFPKARWTMASRSSIARVAAGLGAIDEAIALDTLTGAIWGDLAPDRPESPLSRYQALVSFLGGPENPFSERLQRTSFDVACFIDPLPLPTSSAHITDQWAEQAAGQGMLLSPATKPLTMAPSFRSRGRSQLLARLGVGDRPIVLVHPGSGGLAKCCPLEALEQLSQVLRDNGYFTAWMIGPDEVEQQGPDLIRRLEKAAPVIFEESIEDAAQRVAGADAYIGNDAGMTHVAALLGLPTVAIFGPTNPAIWRPLGPRVDVVPFPSDGFSDWAMAVADLIAKEGPPSTYA